MYLPRSEPTGQTGKLHDKLKHLTVQIEFGYEKPLNS